VRDFAQLTEQEILALAISLEEEHGRIYREYAHGLLPDFAASSQVFREMAAEEDGHRQQLISIYREKFGEHIPLIRSQDVRGFVKHRPIWLTQPLGIEAVRRQAEDIEDETLHFYTEARKRSTDAGIRKLLGDLIAVEAQHGSLVQRLGRDLLTEDALSGENAAQHRRFVLRIVQPSLAGLMDGSVSTLAPLFAAAFATHSTHDTFLVGVASSLGAGISMGFAEALSDDGTLTARGHPWVRGAITGLATAIGGLGHTIPYLLPSIEWATIVAGVVVFIELWAIAWIRARYMDTNFWRASFQVVLGGLIVFATGVLIGSA
jgi:rubrerythrin